MSTGSGWSPEAGGGRQGFPGGAQACPHLDFSTVGPILDFRVQTRVCDHAVATSCKGIRVLSLFPPSLILWGRLLHHVFCISLVPSLCFSSFGLLRFLGSVPNSSPVIRWVLYRSGLEHWGKASRHLRIPTLSGVPGPCCGTCAGPCSSMVWGTFQLPVSRTHFRSKKQNLGMCEASGVVLFLF